MRVYLNNAHLINNIVSCDIRQLGESVLTKQNVLVLSLDILIFLSLRFAGSTDQTLSLVPFPAHVKEIFDVDVVSDATDKSIAVQCIEYCTTSLFRLRFFFK